MSRRLTALIEGALAAFLLATGLTLLTPPPPAQPAVSDISPTTPIADSDTSTFFVSANADWHWTSQNNDADTGAETAPIQPRDLKLAFLNNGFGSDPQTARTLTWLGLDSAHYTAPYVKLAQAGASIDDQDALSSGCSHYALPSGLSGYTSYTCELTGLTPGTTYTYKVGAWSGDYPYESPAYTFQTAASSGEFTFIDFADSQSSPPREYAFYWGNTLRTALDAHPEAAFVTHTGDIVDNSMSLHVAAWVKATGTALSSVAFNPVLGNHDDATAAAPMWANLFPRQSLTAVPTYNEPSTLQYVYVYGNALFLHINTNLGTKDQLATTATWIHDAVAAHGKNADGTNRFIIVVEHKSPFGGDHSGAGTYPSGDHGNQEIVATLPKVFYEEGVDLVLAGHDHNLIRSLPIQWSAATNNAIWDRTKTGLTTINSDTDGLIYYIPRNSGAKTYSLITEPSATSRPWIAYTWRLTSHYRAADNTVYTVVKVTQSQIEVTTYRSGDSTNPVDSFTITQGLT